MVLYNEDDIDEDPLKTIKRIEESVKKEKEKVKTKSKSDKKHAVSKRDDKTNNVKDLKHDKTSSGNDESPMKQKQTKQQSLINEGMIYLDTHLLFFYSILFHMYFIGQKYTL